MVIADLIAKGRRQIRVPRLHSPRPEFRTQHDDFMSIDFQDDVTDEWLLAQKQQDPKGNWSLDHGFVELVVLNTKETAPKFARSAQHQIGCEVLQSKFTSTSVQTTLCPPLQRAEQPELEGLTEKQSRLQCLPLICFFKSLHKQVERNQCRGNVKIEKTGQSLLHERSHKGKSPLMKNRPILSSTGSRGPCVRAPQQKQA